MAESVEIPEAAVEAAAEALWEIDHAYDSVQKGRKWETAADLDALGYAEDVKRERARMQFALQAAAPHIRKQRDDELRKRLEGLERYEEFSLGPEPGGGCLPEADGDFLMREDVLAIFEEAESA